VVFKGFCISEVKPACLLHGPDILIQGLKSETPQVQSKNNFTAIISI
jgi:hypothetical protein